MKYSTKKILSFLVIVSVIALTGCDFIYKNVPFVPIPNQVISGPIEIGSEWIEIIPPNPLKPLGGGHSILVKYSDYAKAKKSDERIWNEDQTILYLADGRKTKIEAFIYDDKGESYELRVGGAGGVIPGFTLSSAAVNIIKNGKLIEIKEDQPLPTNRTFVKLKIRSEILLKCAGIEWVSGKMY